MGMSPSDSGMEEAMDAVLGALERYDQQCAEMVGRWLDMDLYAAVSALVEEMRRCCNGLPRVSLPWSVFLISHSELVFALWRAGSGSSRSPELQACVRRHALAVRSLRQACFRGASKGRTVAKVIEVGEHDFDAAIAGPHPVLVDFTASWCGPCRAMAAALEAFAAHRRDDLTVIRIDIDAAPGIATRVGVRSVPTLALYRDGKPVGVCTGILTESQLCAFVERHART